MDQVVLMKFGHSATDEVSSSRELFHISLSNSLVHILPGSFAFKLLHYQQVLLLVRQVEGWTCHPDLLAFQQSSCLCFVAITGQLGIQVRVSTQSTVFL